MKHLKLTLLICLLGLLNNLVFAQGENFTFFYDGPSRTFKTNNLKPPPETTRSSKTKPPVWLLFWEFGDGHYAVEEQEFGENPTMHHQYAKLGVYKVRLYFTPLYARYMPKPPARTKTITVAAGHTGTPKESYPFRDKSRVAVATNANEEAIPGHNIRVAFGREARGGGHLLLLFNPTEISKEIGFDPFTISDEGGTLTDFHESVLRKKTWPDFLRTAPGQLSSDDLDFIGEKVVNQYNDRVVYEVIKKDYPNAFYSLLVKKELGKKLALIKNVSMAAIWVPEDGSFSRERDVQEFELEVLDVHDPNKIVIRPRNFFFKKKRQKDAEVKVKFKNTGKGVVEQAIIGLVVSKDFNVRGEGVISVDTMKCDPPLNLYRPGMNEDTLRTLRWRTVPGKHRDSLIFTIKGLGLGKKEKGALVFNLKSSGMRPRSAKIDGDIDFVGAKKAKKLSAARPLWRQKGFFLEVGVPLAHSSRITREGSNLMEDYTSRIDRAELADNFFVALTRQNAPMSNGLFYWDYGIRYAKSNILSEGDIPSLELTERVESQYLGISASVGIQVKNFVRVKGSLGVDLPLSLTTTYFDGRDSLSSRGSFQSNHGILQEKESFRGTSKPVIVSGLTAEFGALHAISGGLRLNYVYQPEVYKIKAFEFCSVFGPDLQRVCTQIPELTASARNTTLELFLKIKLGTLGGKR